jgi:hypothetical protein
MTETYSSERPLGVYLVAFYFVLAGFLGAIKTHLEWDAPLSFNLFAEHSIWQLLVDIWLHLAVAYLVWHLASVGRVAALVYGYIHVVMYPTIGLVYLASDTPLHITPLLVSLAVFHTTALIPVIAYLQPAHRKKAFDVSLLELLWSTDGT